MMKGRRSKVRPSKKKRRIKLPLRHIGECLGGFEYDGSGKSKRAAKLSFSSSFCWWARVDSNHRSVTQQIYSLSPLATREHAHILLLRLCEKFRSSQRLFIIAGRNEKCKPFFEFFKSFFQRKGKSNRNLKKNSIKREKTKIWLGAYGAVPVVFVQ